METDCQHQDLILHESPLKSQLESTKYLWVWALSTTLVPNPMGERASSPTHPCESLCFPERWNKTRGQHNHSLNFNWGTRLNVSWDVLNNIQKLLLVLCKKADTSQIYGFFWISEGAQLHTDTELNPSPPANFTVGLSSIHSVLSHWATHYG